jgi:hypothetical protein
MKNSLTLFAQIIVSLFAILLMSCNSDENNDILISDCTNVTCTELFMTIILSIEDQNQNPVALDSFEVLNLDNGFEITIPLSPSELVLAQELGKYPLVADGDIEIDQELQLQFRGFINNQEVINSNYTTSADCCHVILISGELQLVL